MKTMPKSAYDRTSDAYKQTLHLCILYVQFYCQASADELISISSITDAT